MKDLLLVVLLLGVVYPIVIFGLDFLPERARHGQAQKILDSINPSGGKQIIKFYLFMYYFHVSNHCSDLWNFWIVKVLRWKNLANQISRAKCSRFKGYEGATSLHTAYCSSRQQHVRMFQEEQHVLSDMQAKSSLIVNILACIRLIKISFFLKPLK